MMAAVDGEEEEEVEGDVGEEMKNEELLLSLWMIPLDIMDDWNAAVSCKV